VPCAFGCVDGGPVRAELVRSDSQDDLMIH